jgi:hypothetical protein
MEPQRIVILCCCPDEYCWLGTKPGPGIGPYTRMYSTVHISQEKDPMGVYRILKKEYKIDNRWLIELLSHKKKLGPQVS